MTVILFSILRKGTERIDGVIGNQKQKQDNDVKGKKVVSDQDDVVSWNSTQDKIDEM